MNGSHKHNQLHNSTNFQVSVRKKIVFPSTSNNDKGTALVGDNLLRFSSDESTADPTYGEDVMSDFTDNELQDVSGNFFPTDM